MFTNNTYSWSTTADSLAGTHPVDVPGSKSQANHRVQVEKRKKQHANLLKPHNGHAEPRGSEEALKQTVIL